jgi:hypothetical protein
MKLIAVALVVLIGTSLSVISVSIHAAEKGKGAEELTIFEGAPAESIAPTGSIQKSGVSSCSCPTYVTTNIAAPGCTATCNSPDVASCRCFVRNAYSHPPSLNNYCSCR